MKIRRAEMQAFAKKLFRSGLKAATSTASFLESSRGTGYANDSSNSLKSQYRQISICVT
jgi:hypothetical protein